MMSVFSYKTIVFSIIRIIEHKFRPFKHRFFKKNGQFCSMENEIITSKSLIDNQNFVIDYIDDDLVIIDNVNELAAPNPKRLAMNFIATCITGRAQICLNGVPVEVKKNQLLITPPNVVLSDFLVSPDYEFKAILISQRLLQSFLREKINVWNEVMYIYHDHVQTMEEEEVTFFRHFHEILRMCINAKVKNPYGIDVVLSLMRGAFLGLCGALKMKIPGLATSMSGIKSSDNIFRAFLELLNASPITHRTVRSFSDELNITPKYLSYVCKKQSGKTANQWITERIVDEIRFQLKQTDLSNKQVADRLGFPNPSFFGKFVKQHFGMTPNQLREQ